MALIRSRLFYVSRWDHCTTPGINNAQARGRKSLQHSVFNNLPVNREMYRARPILSLNITLSCSFREGADVRVEVSGGGLVYKDVTHLPLGLFFIL